MLDFILFPADVSLYSLVMLISFAKELDATFYVTFSQFLDGERVRGFALGRNFMPGFEFTPYQTYHLQYLKQMRLTLPPSLMPKPRVWSLIDFPHVTDFPRLDRVMRTLDSYGLHLISQRLPSEIIGLVNEFLACPGHQSEFTTLLWNFLCDVAIVTIKAPDISHKFHDDLVKDTESTHTTNYKTRRHKLFSETPGHVYFWDNLQQHPPFVSQRFPASLLRLYTLLDFCFPQIRFSPSVLTSEYRKICEYLSLHRDIALKKYLGRPEFVILFFLGGMRTLKVVPRARNSPFSRLIACESSKYVVLTPLANEIFLHGKMPGSDPNSAHALTLAFRQTARIFELLPHYPLLRQHFPNISLDTNPSIHKIGECSF